MSNALKNGINEREFSNELNTSLDIILSKIKKLSAIERFLIKLILDRGPVKTPNLHSVFNNKQDSDNLSIVISIILVAFFSIYAFVNHEIAYATLLTFLSITAYECLSILKVCHKRFSLRGLYFDVIKYRNPISGTERNGNVNVKKESDIAYWPKKMWVFLEYAMETRNIINKK